jgi:hypothetical protein
VANDPRCLITVRPCLPIQRIVTTEVEQKLGLRTTAEAFAQLG